MTPREAFKAGFLLRCAEEGLTEAQSAERIRLGCEKAAVDLFEVLSQVGKAVPALGGTAARLGAAALPVAMIGGGMAGGAAGHFAGRLLDPGYDAEDLKRQELIAAYDQAADQIEAQTG